MLTLDEGRWQSMERIAGHVASTHPSRDSSSLTMDERFDAALDALVQHVADHGWPEGDFGDMFRAAAAGVTTAAREPFRHLHRSSFWCEPPGTTDAVAEAITDRIAAWQLAWMLPDDQWRAVWGLMEATRRGEGQRTAAALAGMSLTAFKEKLLLARRACLAVWCAPGETLHFYYASHGNKPTKIAMALQKRRERERKAAA